MWTNTLSKVFWGCSSHWLRDCKSSNQTRAPFRHSSRSLLGNNKNACQNKTKQNISLLVMWQKNFKKYKVIWSKIDHLLHRPHFNIFLLYKNRVRIVEDFWRCWWWILFFFFSPCRSNLFILGRKSYSVEQTSPFYSY